MHSENNIIVRHAAWSYPVLRSINSYREALSDAIRGWTCLDSSVPTGHRIVLVNDDPEPDGPPYPHTHHIYYTTGKCLWRLGAKTSALWFGTSNRKSVNA